MAASAICWKYIHDIANHSIGYIHEPFPSCFTILPGLGSMMMAAATGIGLISLQGYCSCQPTSQHQHTEG
jgi:hypothetical protein